MRQLMLLLLIAPTSWQIVMQSLPILEVCHFEREDQSTYKLEFKDCRDWMIDAIKTIPAQSIEVQLPPIDVDEPERDDS